MNTKRILFWASFVIVLILIIWGLIAALSKPAPGTALGAPAQVTATDHIEGPADAPVTIIEYGDFQCPACAIYYPIVTRLMAAASTTARLVFRHFPLPQHANAIPAALASEAANKQGKFWEMYSLLYTDQSEWSELPDASPVFAKYAAQIGLDAAKFAADIKDPALMTAINANKDEGIKLGINATPTFFVNGKAIANPQGYDQFKAIIDAAAQGGSN